MNVVISQYASHHYSLTLLLLPGFCMFDIQSINVTILAVTVIELCICNVNIMNCNTVQWRNSRGQGVKWLLTGKFLLTYREKRGKEKGEKRWKEVKSKKGRWKMEGKEETLQNEERTFLFFFIFIFYFLLLLSLLFLLRCCSSYLALIIFIFCIHL